jgi:thiosulfate dehydrogenase
MRRKWLSITVILLGLALIATACAQPTPTEAPPTSPPPTEPPPTEVVLTGSASRGGKLYDEWWEEAGVNEPTGDQPLWATQTTNTRGGLDTWRCKECHGWDYKGSEGAYGSGSHFTGFVGLLGTAPGMSHAELLAWLDGSTNADHDFTAMGEQAFSDLVIFLSEGVTDVAPYINADTKEAIGGDAGHGEELFTSVCALCHGEDGRTMNFGDAAEPEFVGTVASDNPWEFIHKVRSGQPGTPMPSAIDSGWAIQDVVDVLTYAQTLPTEPPSAESASRGGRLYDKWWNEAGLDEPSGDNPMWARQTTNTRTGLDTWRCKECHGWDYKGAEGAYGSGSHLTGFLGILSAQEKSFDDLMAQLTGQADSQHDFSVMGEQGLTALVRFIREALVDVGPFIDAETKAAIGGDVANGEQLFGSACAACHGEDGRELNFGSEDEPEYVGTLAADNPWEFIHKVRVGQPGTAMPSALDSGWSMQQVVDLLTFSQTLPTEAP